MWLARPRAMGGKIRSKNSLFFTTNSDTYGGNSGSPVVRTGTNKVIGILVRGDNDFVPLRGRNCNVSKKCLENECRGESNSRTWTYDYLVDLEEANFGVNSFELGDNGIGRFRFLTEASGFYRIEVSQPGSHPLVAFNKGVQSLRKAKVIEQMIFKGDGYFKVFANPGEVSVNVDFVDSRPITEKYWGKVPDLAVKVYPGNEVGSIKTRKNEPYFARLFIDRPGKYEIAVSNPKTLIRFYKGPVLTKTPIFIKPISVRHLEAGEYLLGVSGELGSVREFTINVTRMALSQ